MSGGEETGVTVYNHDPAVELAQAESIVREWLPFTRDGEAMCWVMVEYDRRGNELKRLRGVEHDFARLVVEARRDVVAELEKLQAQRAAVLAIHQREDSYVCGGSCSYCRDSDEDPVKWPCPTVQALGVEA